jgi:hypothetical protein
MSTIPLFVNETNLSIGWAKSLQAMSRPGLRGLSPLVVNITGLEEDRPAEVASIRNLLDAALIRGGYATCHTVANTIFPSNLWKKAANRDQLYERYLAILPRLKRRSPANRYGLYFERMIRFGSGPKNGNQLEHLLDLWETNIRRPTALQLNIFDPARDHTRQPRRGFPCLQHVCFTPLGAGKLAVMAVYPSQYIFQRAYGNYLGLIRLGKFVASELELDLTQLTCTIGIALRANTTRAVIRSLMTAVEPHLREFQNPRPAVAVAGRFDG